jgi:glycosyltransferase involved in cell wall biosynthesis
MVIAHVLSSFGMGGQERMALELARSQRAAGHTVLAISLAGGPEGPHAESFRACGARVYTVPKRPGGFDVGLPFRLAAVLRRESARIVHTHNPQPLIYGALGARLARAAIVHTKHGANPDLLRRRALRRGAAALVDAYVAVSKPTAAIARRHRECAPTKLRVITNGVEVERYTQSSEARSALRRAFGIPEDAWVIGTVGRLAPEKDHELLIRAVEPLLCERCWLVIVGDGPQAAELRDLVERMPARRFVRLTGARDDVDRLLSVFDVFALSSSTEGLPLVVPEAMAAGLPVVSTAVGGLPDVVHEGRTGYLVRPNDEHALRAALRALQDDPERARAMGQLARQVAEEQYSALRMARDYMGLYESVLKKKRSARRRSLRPPFALLLNGKRQAPA